MNLSRREAGAGTRLGSVPYWRGEKKVAAALEQIVRKAATAAADALARQAQTAKTADGKGA